MKKNNKLEEAPELKTLFCSIQSLKDLPELTQALLVSTLKFKLHGKSIAKGTLLKTNLFGKGSLVKVQDCIPDSGMVSKATSVQVKMLQARPPRKVVCFGMQQQLNYLSQLIKFSTDKEINQQIRPKSICIQGPPGSGKETLVKKLSETSSVRVRFLEGSDLKQLNKQERARLVYQLQNQSQQIIPVIRSADKLQRPLRLTRTHILISRLALKFPVDKYLNLPNPNLLQRKLVLQGYSALCKQNHMSSEQCQSIAQKCVGFSNADLLQLIRQTAFRGPITMCSVSASLKESKPQNLNRIIAEIPPISWQDIGGYQQAKQKIIRALQYPLKYKEQYSRYGITPIKGILLYGPPGCSKTLMARAVANSSNYFFLNVKGPQLFSKYVGDSQKALRTIFNRARACSPCVIFFDQIDAIATKRDSSTDVSDRLLLTLLTEMDGLTQLKDVVVVGATNRPESIDKALLRPGRLDHLVYIGLPDLQARQEIVRLQVQKMPIVQETKEAIVKQLSQCTEGYTGAEICHIVKNAVLDHLGKSEQLSAREFIESASRIRKRLSALELGKFMRFAEEVQGFQ